MTRLEFSQGAPARSRRLRVRLLTGLLAATSLALAPAATAAPKDKAPLGKAPVAVVEVGAEQEPGVIAVARLAPETSDHGFGWELRAGLKVKNYGKSTVTLTKMLVDTDVTSPEEGEVWAYDDKGKKLPFVIFPGGSREVQLPVTTSASAPPVPETLGARLFFEGYPSPTQVVRPVSVRMNATPSGGYRFPARAEDLPPGVHWSLGKGFHADNQSQRYGYDLGNMAYNEVAKKWDELKWDDDGEFLDETQNESYWIYGRPLYSMHDGTVLACKRLEKDNIPKSDHGVTGGGNGFWIDHGNGEVALYAHLQEDSVPAELCPVESDGTLNATPVEVKAGQPLGNVGNSGATDHPHTHIHVQDAPPTSWEATGDAEGVPLNFHHMDVRVWTGFDPTADEPQKWAHLYAGAPAALGRAALFTPNPCGWIEYAPGGSEVAHHGVPARCWQDTVDAVVAAGYQMTFLDAFETNGEVFFNGIFRPATGQPWAAVHGLDPQAYQDVVDGHDAAGRRLVLADSYLEGGSVRYAAIFGPETGPWAAYHGLTQTDHQAEFDELRIEGYRPVSVSVVSVGGVRRYTAVYDTEPVGTWVLDSTVAEADYQAFFDAQADAGRKLHHLNAYEHGGAIWFSAVFAAAGPDVAAAHGLSATEYQLAWEELIDAGHRTRLVTGYDGGRTARYAAAWEITPRETRSLEAT
jgi:hypothetical protein